MTPGAGVPRAALRGGELGELRRVHVVTGGLRPEDLVVSVTENAREDWSFGDGVGQFAAGRL